MLDEFQLLTTIKTAECNSLLLNKAEWEIERKRVLNMYKVK